MNPKHFRSTAACENCHGYLRYVSTHGCVPCSKAHAYRRRGAHVPAFDASGVVVPQGTQTASVIESPGEQPTPQLDAPPGISTDPLADLIGEI